MDMIGRVDRYQRQHPWLGFPLAVTYKFFDDKGVLLAALITYFGFLSLFPLVLVATTVLRFVLPGNPDLQQQLIGGALARFPVIGDELTNTAQPVQGSGIALVVGILVALYGGLGFTVAVQNALNQVWAVPMVSRPDAVRARLRGLVLLVLLGLGLTFTAALSGLAAGSHGAELSLGLRVAAAAVSVLVNCGLFVFAFRALTARDLTIGQVLPGAIAAAVAWQVLEWFGVLLVSEPEGSDQVYRLFGLVLGLLAWIYLEALVVVFAAEMNVVRAERLWPRALLAPTPFIDDDSLTDADRRSYRSYATAQRYKSFETISVEFTPTPGDERNPTDP